jgi:TRAP-type C4-dicarboxylate transport system permease small subunit
VGEVPEGKAFWHLMWKERGLMKVIYFIVDSLSALCFIGFVLITIMQVFFRYVLGTPLGWSEELARFALVYTVMFGAAAVSHDDSHIKLDVIDKYLSPRLARFQQLVVQLISAAFLLILFWQSIDFVRRSTRVVSPALKIRLSYVYLAIPIGAFFMLLFSFRSILALLRKEVAPHVANHVD